MTATESRELATVWKVMISIILGALFSILLRLFATIFAGSYIININIINIIFLLSTIITPIILYNTLDFSIVEVTEQYDDEQEHTKDEQAPGETA